MIKVAFSSDQTEMVLIVFGRIKTIDHERWRQKKQMHSMEVRFGFTMQPGFASDFWEIDISW